MFNPASREIRWYAVFNVFIMLWLGTQGWGLLTHRLPGETLPFRFAVHMLPAFFLASALVRTDSRPRDWLPFAVVAAGLVTFPIMEQVGWTVSRVWHLAGWCGGAGVYAWRTLQGRGRRPGGKRGRTVGERGLELLLSALVPIGVTGAIFAQGSFVLIVLPVLTTLVLLLIFSGVAYHRFYDIEIRAARTGEIAAAAAEHDRLALLGELSATIAHEVRNPLTGIRSLTQMIAEPGITEERRVRYAGVVLDEVSRLDRIVGNLTDLARRSSRAGAASSDTDLGVLFEDLRLLVDARAQRAGVTIDIAPTDLHVNALRDALAQSLLNLLLNAVAHSPHGGVVRLGALRTSDGTRITVTDGGSGIPESDRARIFEPFHTRGGTGLGLAVVRRLATEHAWSVDVGNADEGGAVFSILLPGVPAR